MAAFLSSPLLPLSSRKRHVPHISALRMVTESPSTAQIQTSKRPGAVETVRVAILGASGYTGAELVRILSQHPFAKISVLTGDRSAGLPYGSVYPQYSYAHSLPVLQSTADVTDWSSEADVLFCCLPHAASQSVISSLPLNSVRVIDLSADFRLFDTKLYEKWYGTPHKAPELQKEAVYGLTEVNREKIVDAKLLANPGCYPTAAQLPLIPLLQKGLISTEGIVIDAKSGVTGAGRSLKQNTLFCEVTEGISAYGVASHRHAPEIEQGLTEAAGGSEVLVRFTPHLVPMSRGILETIYVKMGTGVTAEDLRECLSNVYEKEFFVHVLERDAPAPQTRHVRASNHCVMQVIEDRVPGHAIIISAIDNVVKGASGQAVQNMNLMLGFPETMGLDAPAVFP